MKVFFSFVYPDQKKDTFARRFSVFAALSF